MGKHRGSSGDKPGEPVTGKLDTNDNTFTPNAPTSAPGTTTSGEKVDDGNMIFVEKPKGN